MPIIPSFWRSFFHLKLRSLVQVSGAPIALVGCSFMDPSFIGRLVLIIQAIISMHISELRHCARFRV
jgi:hypothetical protein